MSRLAYFDCFSGASGDMLLGSLLGAGLQLPALQAQIDKLALGSVNLQAKKTMRAGIAATQFSVAWDQQQEHRNLGAIVDLISRACLPQEVVNNACRIFTRLARAEARVHGIDVRQVHFHEVGAVDSIIDIVGFSVGLQQLGIERLHCSPLALGGGTVQCQHGQLPVPAPATLELVKGFPVTAGGQERELTTPTAAAILTTLAQGFGDMPTMVPRDTGYGAGSDQVEGIPNVVRVTIGEGGPCGEAFESDAITVLETQMDDMAGQQLSLLCTLLLAEGALDVVQVPIYMKKGRAGVLVQVLAGHGDVDKLLDMLFRHSSTFGVRQYLATRRKLRPEFVTVKTRWGSVKVKVGYRGSEVIRVAPEYEDCREIAETEGIALCDIIDRARQLAMAQVCEGNGNDNPEPA